MEWEAYHHPDLSLPVLGRQIGNEMVDMLEAFGDVVLTRGWALTQNNSRPSQVAYNMAVYRLRKAGLLAARQEDGTTPHLKLTDVGRAKVSVVLRPEKYWSRKWRGIWYVLSYDVPEKDRSYRNALRGFLLRMRMGCLHRSVWITPCDIRPEYADLVEASGVDQFSHLFESRTVLGRGSDDMVRSAWDFDRLGQLQEHYCRVFESNLQQLTSGGIDRDDVVQLAREELEAYLCTMHDDPLLPSDLWPAGYMGRVVWNLHKRIIKAIRCRLK